MDSQIWTQQPSGPVQINRDWIGLEEIGAVFAPAWGKFDPMRGVAYPSFQPVIGVGGPAFGVTTTSTSLQLAADADDILDTTSCTLLVVRSLRSLSYGNGPSQGYNLSGAQMVEVFCPYSGDGKIYWDFGNNTGTGRVATATAPTFKIGEIDAFAYVAGSRGREIWRNGRRIASAPSATATRSGVLAGFNIGFAASATGTATLENIYFFAALRTQWPEAKLAKWGANPWAVFVPSLLEEIVGPLSSGTDLTVADATHAHAADGLTLTQLHLLAVADAAHAHLADALTLTQTHVLALADALHAHAADAVVLTADATLAVNAALHAHAADAPSLTQAHVLAVADAAHAHGTDNVALTGAGDLVVADAAHAHAADAPSLTQTHILAIADALHAHGTDAIDLDVGGTSLTVAAALHAHAADGLALTQLHVLVVSAALHAHLADTLSLSIPSATVLHDRVIFVRGEGRTLAIVAESRTVTVPADGRTITLH